MKDSPYSFSTVLAVYLLGIAFGSFGMARPWVHGARRARLKFQGPSAFFFMQFLIGAYLWISFAGFCCLDLHVSWIHEALGKNFHVAFQPPPWGSGWGSPGLYVTFLAYPLLFVFVPTLLMGASFPLIASLALRRPDREGTTVGTVYFFNILGNVAGGIVTGYWLLAQFGTERTALGLSIVGLSALLLVDRLGGRPLPRAFRAAAVAVLAVAAVLTFPGRGEFYGLVHGQPQEGRTRYLAEGVGAVVVTDHGPSGTSNWINGLSHGNRPNPWYMGEAVEAFSFAPECRDVLVIGFGAGTFVETALNVNEVEHLTLVEINASVVENFSKIREFKQLLTDPRVSLVIDDGRRFLLRTDHAYDMILIDPMRTTASYSNNLYSREFFELVKRRLKPRGLFLAWTDDFWVFPHTLAGVFPKLRMYGFSEETGFFLASNEPLVENDQRATAILAKYPPAMRQALREDDDYMGDESYVREDTAGCPTSRDWKPVMEYYFWRELQRQRWAKGAGGQ